MDSSDGYFFRPPINNGDFSDHLTMDEYRGQIGGGYDLRTKINVTPKATEEVHSARERRAALAVREVIPQPDFSQSSAEYHLSGQLDDETLSYFGSKIVLTPPLAPSEVPTSQPTNDIFRNPGGYMAPFLTGPGKAGPSNSAQTTSGTFLTGPVGSSTLAPFTARSYTPTSPGLSAGPVDPESSPQNPNFHGVDTIFTPVITRGHHHLASLPAPDNTPTCEVADNSPTEPKFDATSWNMSDICDDADAPNSETGPSGPDLTVPRGRIPTKDSEVMRAAFKALDDILAETSNTLSRPVDNILSLWQNSRAYTVTHQSMWNIYQRYHSKNQAIEAARGGSTSCNTSTLLTLLPHLLTSRSVARVCWESFKQIPEYQKILKNFAELEDTRLMQTTLLQRAQRFKKCSADIQSTVCT